MRSVNTDNRVAAAFPVRRLCGGRMRNRCRDLKVAATILICILLANAPAASQHKHHHRNRPVKADVSVKKISKKDIPAEVMAAFTDKYPTAEIKGQEKQVREKVAFYQIESVDSGKSRDVLFQSDGAIVEVAEGVEESQMPENIQKALKDKYPEGEVSGATCVTRGTHIEYEVAIQVGKKTTEVVVNLAGKVFPVK